MSRFFGHNWIKGILLIVAIEYAVAAVLVLGGHFSIESSWFNTTTHRQLTIVMMALLAAFAVTVWYHMSSHTRNN